MEFLFSLPFLLAIALFIGIVALVKILLSPGSNLERRAYTDRRTGAPMPIMPFYDTNAQLVSEDRRNSRKQDRRKRMFSITVEQKRIQT